MMNVNHGLSSDSKKSWRTGNSPGWTSFTLKQRHGQYPAVDCRDPFPPLVKNNSSSNPINTRTQAALFSSKMPNLIIKQSDCKMPFHAEVNDDPRGKAIFQKNRHARDLCKAKVLHTGADSSLIGDAMASVANDIMRESDLLTGMVYEDACHDEMEIKIVPKYSSEKKSSCSMKISKNDAYVNSLGATSHILLDSHVQDNVPNSEHANFDCPTLNNDEDCTTTSGEMASFPCNFELKEPDIYWCHRKSAIKMTRIASQHSTRATNAYLRGDHESACNLSNKARQEWAVAEKLNAEAAAKIFSINNRKNDTLTLDLHGLHAAEAVDILKVHLQKIEANLSRRSLLSLNKVGFRTGTVKHLSAGSVNCLDEQSENIKPLLNRRANLLQVIIGIGNHSRGNAALPAAVRAFLNENRYRFDEIRPGVVSVHPKFRCG